MSDFPSTHHVAVTVTNLDVSRSWYRKLFNVDPALDETVDPLPGHHRGYYHVVFSLASDFLFALHLHDATSPSDRFDHVRPGLDHISFRCDSRDELEQWQQRLDDLGIEHGGVAEDRHGFALSFRDPDNIALEFWAPPARGQADRAAGSRTRQENGVVPITHPAV